MRIETPADAIEAFLEAPVTEHSDDPRYRVRRVPPREFERVYDCVDAAFDRKRRRVLYDWMYRSNPMGRARVWAVEEISSGTLCKTGAYFPWPIWRGPEPVAGSLSGDAATRPEWQRKGLTRILRRVRRSHAWSGTICTIAGPNEGSRVVTRKAGEAATMLGALPGHLGLIDVARLLEARGLPPSLAHGIARPLNTIAAAWRHRILADPHATPLRVIEVDRFESAFDAVTLRTMSFPGYWSPHGASFLNWRYLDHPTEEYRALALVESDVPVAYAVLRLGGPVATLAEFAVEPGAGGQDRRLLAEAFRLAESAGAGALQFFAPPSWRHARLYSRSGMLRYRTPNHLDAGYKLDETGVQDLRRWQLTPGDRDYR